MSEYSLAVIFTFFMHDVSDYKYSTLTRQIIGCAMKVHRYFGAGFSEIVYKRAMMIELAKSNLSAKSEVEEVVKYYGDIIGKRKVDIIVEDKVLIELKAVTEMDSSCYNQVLNCLKIFNYEVGLLLNFGGKSLQYKRFARTLNKDSE